MKKNRSFLLKNELLDKLSRPENLYIKSSVKEYHHKPDLKMIDQNKVDFLSLYRIDEITFEEKSPRREALENVISSMNIDGVNFVYLIVGDASGIRFYYGVARNYSSNAPLSMEISDIGDVILKPNLQGNFRGSIITELESDEKKKLLLTLDGFSRARILEGVPGINKDNEDFQSVDRLVDVMLGDEFAFMLLAQRMRLEEIFEVQERIYSIYNAINPISRTSVQETTSTSESEGMTKTNGSSETTTSNASIAKQEGENKSSSDTRSWNNEGTGKYDSEGKSHSESKGKTFGKTVTTGDSKSDTTTNSEAKSTQKGNNTGSSATFELINKKVDELLKYLDNVILPRIDYGVGKGLFTSSAVLFGKHNASLIRLENSIRSIYTGETGNKLPFFTSNLNSNEIACFKRMQIPKMEFIDEKIEDEIALRAVYSQNIGKKFTLLGNWISSKELSLFAGLPQKEVVGLSLREEVEFGLNSAHESKEPILLGHLVQSGLVLNGNNGLPNIEVQFDKDYFDRHIFITGVTGSGKTTTCQKLLNESKNNFLVLEPAKTEYRILSEKISDMLVFTLGNESGSPFRLNPFEFFKGESITSRVDMIKASMEAAFDMEAAIPQILETAIYECYEDRGWDISNNQNSKYEDPFSGEVQAFPTLTNLYDKIETVVKKQGFTERLKDEYIGSIRARLKGLMVGAKGAMLDTPRTLNFVELLDKKVVLELESIRSSSEKSLIMGFILSNLTEAIKFKYNKEKKPLNHIILIEEAHRLLSKYTPGDSLNKKHGIEMFSDMLAEVRKYGESLIIVDQIPNKLTSEVLKNTNTKIVHKIFAQDDKDAIGNTMALKNDQKEHLSYLDVGRAVMINPGLSKAVQIKVLQTEDNDTMRMPPSDEILREKILTFYSLICKQGVLSGLEKLEEMPSSEMISLYFNYLQKGSLFRKEYESLIRNFKSSSSYFSGILKDLNEKRKLKDLVKITSVACHKNYRGLEEAILQLFINIINNEKYSAREYDKFSVLDDTLI